MFLTTHASTHTTTNFLLQFENFMVGHGGKFGFLIYEFNLNSNSLKSASTIGHALSVLHTHTR